MKLPTGIGLTPLSIDLIHSQDPLSSTRTPGLLFPNPPLALYCPSLPSLNSSLSLLPVGSDPRTGQRGTAATRAAGRRQPVRGPREPRRPARGTDGGRAAPLPLPRATAAAPPSSLPRARADPATRGSSPSPSSDGGGGSSPSPSSSAGARGGWIQPRRGRIRRRSGAAAARGCGGAGRYVSDNVSDFFLIYFFSDTPPICIGDVSMAYPYRIRIRYGIRPCTGVSG